MRRSARGIFRWATDKPVLSVLLMAGVVRVVFAIGSTIATKGVLIPDEIQYIDLGRAIIHGATPEQWFPGYGQSLFDATATFMEPLVLLFRMFGTHRLVGELFSAVVGAALAGLVVVLGRQFLRTGPAMIAGLLVALLPSQVLFSSVVLREAHVWLALGVIGAGAMLLTSENVRRVAGGVAIAALGFLAMAHLREQAVVLAAWAFGLAALLGARRLWSLRATIGIVAAVFAPTLVGAGLLGYDLTSQVLPKAAATRATLAQGANTGFEPQAAQTPAGPGGKRPSSGATTGGGATGATTPSVQGPEPTASPGVLDVINNGEEGVRAGLSHLPTGIVDVGLRPLPWESTAGITLLFARVENLVWYVLYLLAAVGLLASLRRREARFGLQFPFLVSGMFIGAAALTEGNLGTAFRHRDQILWALALMAAAGVQWLASRFDRRGGVGNGDATELVGPQASMGPRQAPTPASSSASRGAHAS